MERQAQPLRWIEVDVLALQKNFRALTSGAPSGSLGMAVVKSNGYGHGMELVARALEQEKKLWGFGVAHDQEALRLRRQTKRPILVMSYFQPSAARGLVYRGIDVAVYESAQLSALNAAARRLGRHARIHVKIDVGTTRIGVVAKKLPAFLRRAARSSSLEIVGVMSHLGDAESANRAFTLKQISDFSALASSVERLLKKPLIRHIACTAAAIRYPAAAHEIVRLGIGLYGIWPSAAAKKEATFDLEPALTWKTRLLQVKRIPRGTNVGYARSFTSHRPMTIGVLPIGYWDGFAWKASNRAYVLVGGRRCRTVGRVCMNMMMLDVSSVPHAKAGDEVVMLGRQKDQCVTVNELSAWSGSFSYETLARIHADLERIPV